MSRFFSTLLGITGVLAAYLVAFGLLFAATIYALIAAAGTSHHHPQVIRHPSSPSSNQTFASRQFRFERQSSQQSRQESVNDDIEFPRFPVLAEIR